MGNKRRVKFCKDTWCTDTPLSTSFPSLNVYGVDTFLLRMQGKSIKKGDEHRVTLMVSKSGNFSIKFYYSSMVLRS